MSNILDKVRNWRSLKFVAIGILIAGIVIFFWVLVFGYYLEDGFYPNADKAKEIQPFMAGLVAPLFTLGSTLLILENLRMNTQQNFSNNFFKLLDFHHKLVENISSTVEGISGKDLDCKSSDKRAFFDDLATRIAADYNDKKIFGTTVSMQESGKLLLVKIYQYYYNIHQSDIGHYIRHLQHVLKYIEDGGFAQVTRTEMISLLKTQLSNYELLILCYHGIANGNSLAATLEQYKILEWLNLETQITEESQVEKRIIADVELLKETYPHIKDNT